MALPHFKTIKQSDTETKQIKKWQDEILSVLNDNINLTDQFNKDMQCKDANEVSVKLYIYRKNNLMLFHKLLYNHFLTLCETTEELPNMGKKIELKNDNTVTIDNTDLPESNIDATVEVKENITQQWHQTPNKRNGWSMLHSYVIVKPELPEYDPSVVQKLINTDQFLTFALDTIEKDKGYEEAIKIIYNQYIKDDEVLSKQLKIYESYYMNLNENIDNQYVNEINNVLTEYELKMFGDDNEKLQAHVYTELIKMIDVNADMVDITLKSYEDEVKSELYDFFNSNSVLNFVEKSETTGISYNDIMDINEPKEDVKETFKNALGLSEMASDVILNTMRDLEIVNFLYLDGEVVITLVFFATIALIFKKAFNI